LEFDQLSTQTAFFVVVSRHENGAFFLGDRLLTV
jgi:hypothetical protein